MGAWLKFVIVWLVALALPAQGMASAIMTHCGQSHQRMHAAQVDSNQRASAGHRHATHEAASPHQHEAAAAAAAEHDAAPTSHEATQPDDFTDLGKYKCSACASCCSACALWSSTPRVPAPVFAPTVFVAVVPTVDAFVADGPDRPPRIDLA